jgi:hypothetical protein
MVSNGFLGVERMSSDDYLVLRTEDKSPLERDVCKRFIHYLEERYGKDHYDWPFILMHIANERKSTSNKIMDMLYNKSLKSLGMLPGAPDYLIINPFGRVAAIEFKRDKKSCKVKDFQLKFKQKCEELLVPYLLTCDPDEAFGWVEDFCDLL